MHFIKKSKNEIKLQKGQWGMIFYPNSKSHNFLVKY